MGRSDKFATLIYKPFDFVDPLGVAAYGQPCCAEEATTRGIFPAGPDFGLITTHTYFMGAHFLLCHYLRVNAGTSVLNVPTAHPFLLLLVLLFRLIYAHLRFLCFLPPRHV